MAISSKVRRRIGITLGALVLTPVVLLVLVLLALQFRPVRTAARDQLLALIVGSLQGRVELDDLRWPSLTHVELSGVRVWDRHGTFVANLGLVSADIDLPPLLAAKVHLTQVTADGLYLDFADLGSDRGFLSVFESKEPKPPEPESEGSAIAIQIDRVCAQGSEIVAAPQPDLHVGFHRFDTCAMFAMGDDMKVRLDQLRGEVRYNKKPTVAFIDEKALAALDAAEADPKDELAKTFLKGQLTIAKPAIGFDGRLEVRNVNKQTLQAAQVDADWLTGAAHASLAARGDASHMTFTLDLRAPDSLVRVQGEVEPEHFAKVHIASEGLSLAKFTTIQTERAAFDLQVNADLARAAGPSIKAALASGTYGAWALPVTYVQAEVGKNGAVNVPRFEARYPGASVEARARLAEGGALQATVEAKLDDLARVPPLAESLPGWAGRLTASAELSRPSEAGDISLTAHAALAKLRAAEPALAAELIDLKLTAKGQPDKPAITANVSGREIAFEDQRVGELQLAATGGPTEYRLHGRVDGDRGRLDAWLKPRDAGLEAGGQLTAKLPRGEAKASVKRVQLDSGHSLEIEALRVEHLGATVSADGSLGLAGKKSQIQIDARTDNLSALTQEFAGSEVPGKLALTAKVTGELEKPAVDLSLEFRDGPRLAGAASELSLRAQLDAAQSKSKVTARGSAGKAVVRAVLDSRWGRGAPLSAAVDGHHELELNLDRLAIHEMLRQSDTTLPIPLAGAVSARVKASGNRKQLDLSTQVDAKVAVGNEPELDVKLITEYGGGGLAFNAVVDDTWGHLLTVNWHQETRVESFADNPPKLPDWLGQTAWEASVELASRRIAELPTVKTQRTAHDLWPLRAEASIQVSHKPNVEPEADVRVLTRWDPRSDIDPSRATCSQRVTPKIELEGKLRDGVFISELRGLAADQKMLSVKTELRSLLGEWLEGHPLQVTRARLNAEAQGFDLAQWPVTCEQAAGLLNARFVATDMFDKRAKFQAKLSGERIVVGQSLPIDFQTQAQALPSGMDVVTRIDRIGGFALIKGSVPVSVYVHDPATSVDPNGNLSLEVSFTRVDAKSLLALVPAIARPSGQFDGHIQVYGTLAKPRGTGEIKMKDLSMTLPKLGQRFTKVNGTVAIADNRVRIPELEVRDQGGSAKFRAELELDSTDAFKVDLNAKFDDFPLRKQGVLIGRADAAAKVHVDAKPAQSDVEVRLSNVSINLTGDTAADVQSLDAHPEIAVAGEEVDVEEEEEAEAERRATILNVYVRSDEPLWVRRDDFAIRMRTDLGVHVANGAAQISGEVKLERGYLSLLGQEFDVKAGRVIFTGGQAVNPSLELTAQATSPSGKVVRVDVTGFVRAPKLAFFVNEEAAEPGEALLALSGRGDSNSNAGESAENQLASAAIGMTTGLLSLGARREFGDFIPMLSIDQDTEDTRVRAGFEVDKLIPSFMRGFVHGAYVEGVVSTGNENARGDNTGGNAQTGVLLELMLPSDLVWAGKYGPGQTWSVDLDWRP